VVHSVFCCTSRQRHVNPRLKQGVATLLTECLNLFQVRYKLGWINGNKKGVVAGLHAWAFLYFRRIGGGHGNNIRFSHIAFFKVLVNCVTSFQRLLSEYRGKFFHGFFSVLCHIFYKSFTFIAFLSLQRWYKEQYCDKINVGKGEGQAMPPEHM